MLRVKNIIVEIRNSVDYLDNRTDIAIRMNKWNESAGQELSWKVLRKIKTVETIKVKGEMEDKNSS